MIVNSLQYNSDYDVCVVGAGPVGISTALECERHGLKVALIESGEDKSDRPDSGSFYQIDLPQHHDPYEVVTRRGLGGTSKAWGGACIPFDDIDFEERAYVPYSGWPIGRSDIRPFEARASELLACDPPAFSDEPSSETGTPSFEESRIRWSRNRDIGALVAKRLRTSKNIHFLEDAEVTDLIFSEASAQLQQIRIKHQNFHLTLAARHYVIACGGLGNAYLLLKAQAARPDRFGGKNGPLGRYYTGHLAGAISVVQFATDQIPTALDYATDSTETRTRCCLALSRTAQKQLGLLNIHFTLDNPPFSDPRHNSSTLSLVHLMSGPLRALRVFPEHPFLMPLERIDLGTTFAHLSNVARSPLSIADHVPKMIKAKVARKDVVINNPGRLYSLRFHAEQAPDPENRVVLDPGERGSPQAKISFRFSDGDADSIVKAHDVFAEWLRSSGRGQFRYLFAGSASDGILRQARDGYHQTGLTRMSDTPATGVVNKNCQVHDVPNLFIAGSSVFPTSGRAKPTFTAVALAVRLARHLAEITTGRPMATAASFQAVSDGVMS